MRNFYYKPNKNFKPFKYELDAIVLDCYEPGKDMGRQTVWKKYREIFDELTYDTIKVVTNKRRL